MSQATMHTTQGAIEIELFDEDAPKTVSNTLSTIFTNTCKSVASSTTC